MHIPYDIKFTQISEFGVSFCVNVVCGHSTCAYFIHVAHCVVGAVVSHFRWPINSPVSAFQFFIPFSSFLFRPFPSRSHSPHFRKKKTSMSSIVFNNIQQTLLVHTAFYVRIPTNCANPGLIEVQPFAHSMKMYTTDSAWGEDGYI